MQYQRPRKPAPEGIASPAIGAPRRAGAGGVWAPEGRSKSVSLVWLRGGLVVRRGWEVGLGCLVLGQKAKNEADGQSRR